VHMLCECDLLRVPMRTMSGRPPAPVLRDSCSMASRGGLCVLPAAGDLPWSSQSCALESGSVGIRTFAMTSFFITLRGVKWANSV